MTARHPVRIGLGMNDGIRKLIERLAPKSVCDDCIAERLTLAAQEVSRATLELAGTSEFERHRAVCSLCDGEKPTIRRPQ